MSIKIHFYLFVISAYMYMIGKFKLFLICYISILIHELAHVTVALFLNVDVVEINLLPVGVCAIYNKTISPTKEILISIAGPFMSFILAFFAKTEFIRCINIVIMLLNLIPIFPLDGGKILKNIFIYKFKMKKGIKISEFINDLFLIILFAVSIVFVIYFKNFNLIILTVYILFLSKEEIKKEKILRVLNYLQMEE